MPRFTVVWRRSAQDELARIWLAATDRRSITAASDRIDAALAVDPEDAGSDFWNEFRELKIDPLGVIFGVRDLDRIVEVVAVKML